MENAFHNEMEEAQTETSQGSSFMSNPAVQAGCFSLIGMAVGYATKTVLVKRQSNKKTEKPVSTKAK